MDLFGMPTVKKAERSKSLSYFCKHDLVAVDRETIDSLKRLSVENGSQDVRICLHSGPEANFHNMVILQYPGRYYKPHRHPAKPETIHIIEGMLRVVVFDEKGQIYESYDLDKNKSLIYRIGINHYHTVFPMEPFAIYHESKPGPFLGDEETEFAPWAPEMD